MSLCIKSTQVWVFPERRDTEKLFPLTCRWGERVAKEALSGGHPSVTLLSVSVEAQSESFSIKQSSIMELYVKCSSGTMPR